MGAAHTAQERAVGIGRADGRTALEGIFLAGGDSEAAGAVVAPPHPLYGGSMDSPVVSEIAYACRAAGLASLRFNWRGVGASAGAVSGEPDEADEDYSAATRYLEETLPGALVAAGYSFGAAAALRAAGRHPRVRRLLLVAPPRALLDEAALRSFGGPVLLVAGEYDALAPAAELEALAAGLPKAQLRTVPEADHFFVSGLGLLGRAVEEWI